MRPRSSSTIQMLYQLQLPLQLQLLGIIPGTPLGASQEQELAWNSPLSLPWSIGAPLEAQEELHLGDIEGLPLGAL